MYTDRTYEQNLAMRVYYEQRLRNLHGPIVIVEEEKQEQEEASEEFKIEK